MGGMNRLHERRLRVLCAVIYLLAISGAGGADGASASRAGGSGTVIVTSDNRDLSFEEGSPPPLHVIAAARNQAYAESMGYDLLYYHVIIDNYEHPNPVQPQKGYSKAPEDYIRKKKNHKAKKGSITCWLLRGGQSIARAPSGCKIPVVAHALSLGYRRVLFLDSDAWVHNAGVSLDGWLEQSEKALSWYDRARLKPYLLRTTPSLFDRRFVPPSEADLIFPDNRPDRSLKRMANCGAFVAKDSSFTRDFLRVWWNINWGKANMEHDYEQAAATDMLTHLEGLDRRVAILGRATMALAFGLDGLEPESLDDMRIRPDLHRARAVPPFPSSKTRENGLPWKLPTRSRAAYYEEGSPTAANDPRLADVYCAPNQYICHAAGLDSAESAALASRPAGKLGETLAPTKAGWGDPELVREIAKRVSIVRVNATGFGATLLAPRGDDLERVERVERGTEEVAEILSGRQKSPPMPRERGRVKEKTRRAREDMSRPEGEARLTEREKATFIVSGRKSYGVKREGRGGGLRKARARMESS